MTQPKLERGLIVANYGRHFLVETTEGERRICHSRGKKSTGLVGDRVLWQASEDEGTIEKIEKNNLVTVPVVNESPDFTIVETRSTI